MTKPLLRQRADTVTRARARDIVTFSVRSAQGSSNDVNIVVKYLRIVREIKYNIKMLIVKAAT